MKKILMFTTKTCAPCKQMKEIMSTVDHTGIHLEYLDARDEAALVVKYGIKSVPTLALVEDDSLLDKHSGIMSVDEYVDWLGKAA